MDIGFECRGGGVLQHNGRLAPRRRLGGTHSLRERVGRRVLRRVALCASPRLFTPVGVKRRCSHHESRAAPALAVAPLLPHLAVGHAGVSGAAFSAAAERAATASLPTTATCSQPGGVKSCRGGDSLPPDHGDLFTAGRCEELPGRRQPPSRPRRPALGTPCSSRARS